MNNSIEMKTEATAAVQSPAVRPEEPSWLQSKRHAAWKAYLDLPLPQQRLHLWRYTDPVRFLVNPQNFPDGKADDNGLKESLTRKLNSGRLAAVAVDLAGREFWRESSPRIQSNGVIVTPLSQALRDYPSLVEDHLYHLIDEGNGKFEAFNSAFWQEGIFVYVPDHQVLELPLHLVHQSAPGVALQVSRLLIVTGKSSDVTLIDEYSGGSSDPAQPGYLFAAVEIYAGDAGRVRYVNLQRQAPAMTSYLTHRARIGQDGSVLTIPLAFGAALCKQNYGILLDGPGAESKIYGLLFGSGRQHFDNHTLHHHRAGHTTSNIDFKVVLRDKALSAYTGLIRIDRQAPGCQAYQENRNLILGQGARAETIPELEILNEDVSCTHGATVGPIDPEMVFYLASRGIRPEDAVRTIVTGFVASTLRNLPADLRGRVAGVVADRLEGI